MSYKAHGVSIQSLPLLQPGSSFNVTEAGFDTGSRTFRVDQGALASVLPVRGFADVSMSYIGINGRPTKGGRYGMYVDSISGINELRNNLAEYTVNYLGLVTARKNAFFRYGTSYSIVTVPAPSVSATATTTEDEALPTATRVYVSNTRPNPNSLGLSAAFFELLAITPVAAGATLGGTIISKGWKLSNRDVKQCGPLFEVSDTYNYIIQRPN